MVKQQLSQVDPISPLNVTAERAEYLAESVSERRRGKSESEEREREREKVRGGERDIRENQCCVHQGQNVMTLFSFFFFYSVV